MSLAPDFAWIFDYDTQKFTYASAQVERVLGYAPAEVSDLTLTQLFDDEWIGRIRDVFASRLCEFGADQPETGDGGRFTETVAMVHRDGSTVWIEAAGSLALNDSGAVFAAGIARDVTERYAEQVRLRDSEERYRLAIQYSATGLVVLDATGRVLEVSEPFCEMVGCGPNRLRGELFSEVIDSEYRAGFLDSFSRLVTDGAGSLRSRVRFTRQDGGVSWGDMAGVAVRRSDEAIRYVIVRVADITAQTHAEEELSRISHSWAIERERLRHTLDSVRDSIVLLEAVRAADGIIADFRLLDLNRAAELAGGIDRLAATGRLMSDLYPSQEQLQIQQDYIRAIETQIPVTISNVEWGSGQNHPDTTRRFEIGIVPFGDTVTATWRDVTEQYRSEQALAQSEERYRLIAKNLSGVVVKVSVDDVIDWVSPSLTETMGWSPDDWVGHVVTDFFHPDDLSVRESVAEEARHGRPHAARWRVIDSAGEYHWAQFMARPYINAAGKRDGMVGTFRVVDTEVAYEHELERRARYDDLSGLLNRRSILDKVAGAVGADRRGRGKLSAVLFCDIDRLKEANDTHGHSGGDALIVAVAQRMLSAVREADSVGRIGGDEFLILLDGIHEIEDALAVAEKVRAFAHGEIVLPDGSSLDPSLSIGLAIAQPGEGVSALVERANSGLFDAKRNGRDRVVLISNGD